MDFLDDKDFSETITLDDDKEFRDFLDVTPSGLAFIPEKGSKDGELLMKACAGEFSKWIKRENPEINIDKRKADKKLVLHSSDIWFPLVYLANDITLPMYINLVSNYIYNKFSGSLSNDSTRVHIDVVYENKKDGVTKKFSFEGDIKDINKVIEPINVNKVLDD